MAIRRLSNGQVYVDGLAAAGTFQTFELPTIVYEQIEYNSLGSVGTLELPAGTIEAMEATATMMHLPPELGRLLFNPSYTSQLQIRADQATFAGKGLAKPGNYVVIMDTRPKEIALGTFEKAEAVMPEATFAVDRITISIDGEQVLKVDAANPNGVTVAGALVSLLGSLL